MAATIETANVNVVTATTAEIVNRKEGAGEEKVSSWDLEFMNSNNSNRKGRMNNVRPLLKAATAKKVVTYAKKKEKQLRGSKYFTEFTPIPKDYMPVQLEHHEIQLGRLLGEGSFAQVYAMRNTTSSALLSKNDDNSNKINKNNRFVVKVLKPHLLQTPGLFASCVVDINKEACFLSRIRPHDHIIRLVGVAKHGIAAYESGRNDAFFTVMEQVDCTLADAIDKWDDKKIQQSLFFMTKKQQIKKELSHVYKTLQLSIQLASALAHVHDHHLLHRDIKPDNIGIVIRGGGRKDIHNKNNLQVRLFDFDVARLVPSKTHSSFFKLTKAIGTKRFMSPECYNGAYNISSDIYSFALVTYYMLSLEQPYDGMTVEDLPECVYQQGLRPSISNTWPNELQSLISRAWSQDCLKRPSMQTVHDELSDIATTWQKRRNSDRNQSKRISFFQLLLPSSRDNENQTKSNSDSSVESGTARLSAHFSTLSM